MELLEEATATIQKMNQVKSDIEVTKGQSKQVIKFHETLNVNFPVLSLMNGHWTFSFPRGLMEFLEEAKAKFQKMSPVESNIEIIQGQMKQVKEFANTLNVKFPFFFHCKLDERAAGQ